MRINKFHLIFLTGIGALELISQFSVLLIGIPQWVTPWALWDLVQNGFWQQISIAGALTFVLIGSFIGINKGGFYRYIGSLFLGFFTSGLILSLLGVVLFSSLYLDDETSFFTLLAQRSLYPDLWINFIRIEGVILFLSGLAATYLYMERHHSEKKILGDAHFANGFEMQKGGFFKKEAESIIVGKVYGVSLYSNGFEHVLVFAPCGSGKTRSIGIPNLLHYPYSVVCNDVKLTMFKTTSGYRQKVLGHKCYCWAPTQLKTHRYNPLSLISEDKIHRMTDIQRIAHILIPDNKKSDPIWQQASRKLFKALVLYLLDTPERLKTLGEINRLIKQQAFDDWLATMLEESNHLDPECYRNAYSYLNNHEKTRSSILETLSGYLELFDDPIIDAATSASDFDLSLLRKEKITIYIGFTDDDMERLAPILTLFWQQLISVMIQKVPDVKEEPYPLLCLIDEFSSLGRIERLRRSLKLLREYRVRCVLMLQYIAQTYEQYSHDEAKAFTNIKTKVAFTADDINDAEYISKLLGTQTIKVKSHSVSRQLKGSSQSESYQYQAAPLLKTEEIMRLSLDKSLIMRAGHAPIRASQYIWYLEKETKTLAQDAAGLPELSIITFPFVRADFSPGETSSR